MTDSINTRIVHYQLADGTVQVVTERLELLTTFDASAKGSNTDGRTGDLILKLAVPLTDRQAAYVLDEQPGLMFTIKVYKPVPLNGAAVPTELDPWVMGNE